MGFLHAPEVIFLVVFLLIFLGCAWVFGVTVGRGIARGQKK